MFKAPWATHDLCHIFVVLLYEVIATVCSWGCQNDLEWAPNLAAPLLDATAHTPPLPDFPSLTFRPSWLKAHPGLQVPQEPPPMADLEVQGT